jgi:cbb3-type cytochrome oxidase subunit 3
MARLYVGMMLIVIVICYAFNEQNKKDMAQCEKNYSYSTCVSLLR